MGAAAKYDDSPADLMTARELVDALARNGYGEYSTSAPRQWLREEPAVPVAKPGKRGQAHRYSYSEVVDWLKVREQQVKVKSYTAPGESVEPADNQAPEVHYSDPRLAKAYEEAQLARIRRLQLEQQLIDVNEIAPAWSRVIVGLRSALLALPRKLDQMLEGVEPGEERVKLLEREIETALREAREDVAPGK